MDMDSPDTVIIPLTEAGALLFIPEGLERWKEAMEGFIASDFHNVTLQEGHVAFLRVRPIHAAEQPTLFQQLCTVPAHALKFYTLIRPKRR
jgi:hypothetical protein